MAAGPTTVLITLADAERADELAGLLSEEHGLSVVLPSRLDAEGEPDVLLADQRPQNSSVPFVLLQSEGASHDGASPPSAVLPVGVDAGLIAAALTLAAAGYRVSAERGPTRGTGTALSPREAEVLALLAEGAPNKVIARRLDISVHTAKFHVAAIIAKLAAANRTDAIAIAMRDGLVHV